MYGGKIKHKNSYGEELPSRTQPPFIYSGLLLFMTFILCISQIDKILPIWSIISIILFSIYIGSWIIIRKGTYKINLLLTLISISIFISSMLLRINSMIPIATYIIALISIIYIEIDVRLKTLKNICLEIIDIETIDYESEIIILEEKRLSIKFIMIYDLGDKLKIGTSFNFDKLKYNQYKSVVFNYKGKEIKGYCFTNINKDKLFDKFNKEI